MRGVFDSVAGKYDLMNDLMSAGLHRLWKRFAVSATGVRAGMRVLDLAGGTGDLARLFADRVGPSGQVVLTDINGAMLAAGRDKLLNEGALVPAVQCDAERLPFPGRALRLRQHRIRAAQRDAQGGGARRDAARAEAGRRRGGARVLARLGAARARVRLVQLQRAAADRQARRRRRRELSLSRRIDPRAPGPGRR